MTTSPTRDLRSRLGDIRDELGELAFALERRGNPEAADVALTIRARIDELCLDFPKNCPEQAESFVE